MVYLISLQLFWRKSKYRTQPNAKNTNAHFFNTVSTEIIIIIIITLWSYSDSELIGKKNREKILFFSYSIFSHSADDSLIAYLIESRSNLIRIFVEKNNFFFHTLSIGFDLALIHFRYYSLLECNRIHFGRSRIFE